MELARFFLFVTFLISAVSSSVVTAESGKNGDKTLQAGSSAADKQRLSKLDELKLALSNSEKLNPTKSKLEKIKSIRADYSARLSDIGVSPGGFRLRISRGRDYGALNDHCLTTLLLCFNYNQKMEKTAELKKNFLKDILQTAVMQLGNSEGFRNALSHPICVDSFKTAGDALSAKQIRWFAKNTPPTFFENPYILQKLTDFSWLSDELYSNFMKTGSAVGLNLLKVIPFVSTIPIPALAIYMHSKFHPCLLEDAETAEALKGRLLGNLQEPTFYPFILALSHKFEGLIPSDYVLNVEPLIAGAKLEINPLILTSIIAYVLETNNRLQNNFQTIFKSWRSHLRMLASSQEADVVAKSKLNFNETARACLKELEAIVKGRESLSAFINQMRSMELNVVSAVQSLPNWIICIHLLSQTPINALMRIVFSARASPSYRFSVHPEDVDNVIQLPRITEESVDAALDSLVFTAIWRHLLGPLASNWQEEVAKFDEINDKSARDRTVNAFFLSNWKIVYRDNGVSEMALISLWNTLCSILPPVASFGFLGVMFLEDLACMALPAQACQFLESFDLEEFMAGRKQFSDAFASTYATIHPLAFGFKEPLHISSLMTDVESTRALIYQKRNEIKVAQKEFMKNPKHPFERTVCDFEEVATNTAKVQEILDLIHSPKAINLKKLQLVFYQFSRQFETFLQSQGETMSDDVLMKIWTSDVLFSFLSKNGRLLPRSCIKGLLKSTRGKKFLSVNPSIVQNLQSYESFTAEDFEVLKVNLSEVTEGICSLPFAEKVILFSSLNGAGFDDPMYVALMLGQEFWGDVEVVRNLYTWEMLNPIMLAYDEDFAKNVRWDYQMSSLKSKLLQIEAFIPAVIVMIAKWLIVQDWYSFIFHVSLAMSNMSQENAELITTKYVQYLSDEAAGRREAREWLDSKLEDLLIIDETVVAELISIRLALDIPLSPFRGAVINCTGGADAAISRNADFLFHSPSSSYLRSNTDFVANMVRKYYGRDEYIWLARLKTLCQFEIKGNSVVMTGTYEIARAVTTILPAFDAMLAREAFLMMGTEADDIDAVTDASGPINFNSSRANSNFLKSAN